MPGFSPSSYQDASPSRGSGESPHDAEALLREAFRLTDAASEARRASDTLSHINEHEWGHRTNDERAEASNAGRTAARVAGDATAYAKDFLRQNMPNLSLRTGEVKVPPDNVRYFVGRTEFTGYDLVDRDNVDRTNGGYRTVARPADPATPVYEVPAENITILPAGNRPPAA